MKKKIIIRIPKQFYVQMLKDLRCPHPFAGERVGFLTTKLSSVDKSFCIVTIIAWDPVPDNEYINEPSVGAKISGSVIRGEMEKIINTGHGKIHVHLHDHCGNPSPSYTDLKSLPEVSAALHNADPNAAVGYMILSEDSFFCKLSTSPNFKLAQISRLSVVGYPFILMEENSSEEANENKIYNRQSFLGQHAQQLLSNHTIGIVGVGGGGSHIAQQLAHLGIHRFRLFDHDQIEDSNHNRLIGGWFSDIKRKMNKTLIAKRLIKKINPLTQVIVFDSKWQDKANELSKCDIVIGCVDSYSEREQLEASCRRYLIPYIDIGMDVHKVPDHGFSIAGQIILSMPGSVCLRCMQFITEKKLAAEAAKYGVAGNRPQVVWPNGILASTAVGIAVDLITGWTRISDRKIYLSYDGELGHVTDNPRIEHCCENCSHYQLTDTGDASFIRV